MPQCVLLKEPQFDYLFASEHDIRGSFEAVNDGLTTGVQVIKASLDDGIVDIHRRRQQLSGLGHLVQPVDPGDGLLHNPLEGVHLEDGVVLLDQEMSGVAAIVENHVGLPGFVGDTAVNTPPEIVFVLATPGKDRNAFFCQCSSNLVLGAVNVASCPTDLKIEKIQINKESSKKSQNVMKGEKVRENLFTFKLCSADLPSI